MFTRQIQADLWLALVAMMWGATFVVVKNELAYIGPLAFIVLRFTVAFLAMSLIAWRPLARINRAQLAAGILIGIFLFGGYALQTIGLRYTSASKAAFITGLCVALAPLLARLLLGQTPSLLAVAGVVLATTGLALLSMVGDLNLALGDLLVLGCAASFALHIVAISHFAPKMDTTTLATVQIGVVPIAAAVAMTFLEPFPTTISPGTLGVAALMGIFATAFAFTIQTRAQAFTTPTHTALVLSLEPVFGALFAYLIGGERLGGREILGCALILAGMLVAEIKRDR